jgi:hypothetical protein
MVSADAVLVAIAVAIRDDVSRLDADDEMYVVDPVVTTVPVLPVVADVLVMGGV